MSIATVNYLDLFVGVFILVLAVKGIFKGFWREFFSLLALLGGVAISSRVAPSLAQWSQDHLLSLPNHAMQEMLAFLLSFLLIWGAITILGKKLLDPMFRLSAIEMIFGYFTAGIKYFLIFSIITTILFQSQLFQDKLRHQKEASKLYPLLEKSGAWLMNLPPLSSRPQN